MQKKEQYLKFDSIEDAEKYAEKTGNLIMYMENQVIDATTFAKHHPGGPANVAAAKGKDITEDIKAHFPLA
jgi:cytochrome b involved in lipid metabolism